MFTHLCTSLFACSAGRFEVDGYVYNAAEEPKMLITGKWNESMSYQPCDVEGEPLPGTELKEVGFSNFLCLFPFLAGLNIYLHSTKHQHHPVSC